MAAKCKIISFFFIILFKSKFNKLSSDIVFKALKNVYKKSSGGYAVIMLVAGIGILAFRDPRGIRPLILGKKNGAYMVASESSAINAMGYEIIRDIEPGEAIIITEKGKLINYKYKINKIHSPCLFEFVYFSRPDSTIDSISVHKARLRMGDYLGQKILDEYNNLNIDVVIPVPDTSRTSAMQVAYKLGIKYREGFMKNRYIGRTFIMPGQAKRKRSVAQKLSPIEIEFKNKNVLLVDDSIVRGHTSKKIIQMVRNNGAKKVFFASASPPIKYQNVYGIDMPARSELIANKRTIDQIKTFIGADALIYQNLKDLKLAAQIGNPKIERFEDSVFTGKYCAGKITNKFLKKLESRRSDIVR